MKLKSIVIAISCLLMLGVSANVFAATDSTGEALTSNVDILSASVVTSDQASTAEPPNKINLGVKMNDGSHLPAAIIFDFDVDNDTATGGGSIITSLPSRQCGGDVCKADAGGGFDFYVNIILRSQGDGAPLANCSGCSGGASSCVLRGPAGVNCNETDCYELGESCTAGTPGCYETSGVCTGCDGPLTSYVMNVVCGEGETPSCARPYIKGEWNVGFGQFGRIMNGNINLPMAYGAVNEADICAELPWGIIMLKAQTIITAYADPEHLPFNTPAAFLNPPKYQVTALFDTGLPFDGDDFTQYYPAGSGFNLAVRDWMPDTARVADGETNEWGPCAHNSEGGYGDVDVDANDVTDFLNEFGRGQFFQPCPTCKN